MTPSRMVALVSSLFFAACLTAAAPSGVRKAPSTFFNPVLDASAADPWVLQFRDAYYLLPTMSDGSISVYKSKSLTSWDNTKPIQVVKRSGAWAPELHVLNKTELWIYAATQDGRDKESDRKMHAYRASDDADPTKPFKDMGVVKTPDDNFAIDGTVLKNYNGKNYFIWSGKKDRKQKYVQYLYIAEMASPTKLVGNRTMIHSPFQGNAVNGKKINWQWAGTSGVNEGPEILVHGNKTMLIYSACGSWTDCYSLGLMYLEGNDKNPLNPKDWVVQDDAPIFSSSDKTLGVGHASFPYDAKGKPWMIYHGWNKGQKGWGARTTRAQSYSFKADGTPKFADPATAGVSIKAAAAF